MNSRRSTSAPTRRAVGRREPKSFVEYRRKYVSDRTWFGLGLIAIGLGNFAAEQGWLRILTVAFGLVGVALLASGVRRAWRRPDPVSDEQRPSAPW